MKTTIIFRLLLTAVGFFSEMKLSAQTKPFVDITNVPPFGVTGYLEGRATFNESNPCGVAVYIKVNEGWWNKPTFAQRLTSINSNGFWCCNVSTYPPTDVYATEYAAFLVLLSASDNVPILDGKPLSEQLDEVALAKDLAIRTPLSFSGMAWEVKATVPAPLGSPIDPGPNWFSTNNAWVDGTGRLHLLIHKEVQDGTNKWTCAEVICGRAFGYGLYRFYLDTPVGTFDPSVVFSPFTYSDYSNYAHREIDIEFTTWNDTVTNGNTQYALQQWANPVMVERFECDPGVTKSVHSFVWAPWRVDFKSLQGHDPTSTAPSDLIKQWSFTNASRIPPAGPVRPRINLYLSRSQPPTDSNEVEVVVSRFEYQPLLRFLDVELDARGRNVRLTTQQEVAGLLTLESCTNLTTTTNYWTSQTNIVGEVGMPVHFEFPTNNSPWFFRGGRREQ